ncbi:MAG: hypothetical protein C0399_11920 [Syntrophus sp. (in: bacteria)]|nr:hypothetical protein [Syntrophus sp. (in: bacteria)]MBA4418992.1 hypothetical protein [Syntrophus sp. (in: bacteria)]
MSNFLRFILIISFWFVFMFPCFANAQDMFNLSRDGLINVNINNKPLNEVLRSLSLKFSIELKGYSVGNEAVNLNISNISFEDMLKRIMRGYNYVLIKPDRSQKSVLMVLSKVERTKYVDVPPSATPPPPPSATPPVQQPMATPIPSPQPSPVPPK